jgi:CAAX prenyl protease-like protein
LEAARPKEAAGNAWAGYVVPMALFMALTMAESSFPAAAIHLYFLKALLVTAALAAFRAPLRDIRFDSRVVLPAVAVGILVFVEWIVVDPRTPHFAFLGQRAATNPFTSVPDPLQRAAFLAVRFYGLVLMVPVMEELFWRSFLLRWITKPEFEDLPLGAYNLTAFAAVALLFGFAHQEWLAAILCACAYGMLLRRTHSLFACIVAHAITNLALGLYILSTGQWHYW